MGIVRPIVEHGGMRKGARPQFIVKGDILRVRGEVVDAFLEFPVFLHRKGMARALDVVLHEKVAVEVARRIGG